MKKIKITLIYFAVAAFLFSCSDEFLDIDPQMNLSTDMAIGNVADATVALTGVYDGLQSTETYYARDFVVAADISGDDVKVSPQNSGRFLTEYNLSWTAAGGVHGGFWNRAYNTINRTNNILSRIDGLEAIGPNQIAEKDHIQGEALALRALVHFDLVRVFAKPYSWDPNALGVPYMSASVISLPARDPLSFVYDRIIEDLLDAIDYLTMPEGVTIRPRGPEAFTLRGAQALLARVYLYKGDWANARAMAETVINSNKYSLVSNANYIQSWGQDFSTESIFSIAMIHPNDYSATNALGYIYVRAGYGDLHPTNEIINLLENAGGTAPGDDVRFDAFIKMESNDVQYINKFPGRGGVNGLDNTPVIRLSEMYLIAAEAAANIGGQDAAAQGFLNAIVKRGNPNAADITLTGDALKERIALEKRIEFAFEGHRFFDIKRRSENLSRGADCTADVCFLEHGSNRLILPIPRREIEANPNMVQNPGY